MYVEGDDHQPQIGSYGLDQCFNAVATSLAGARGRPAPEGWLIGEGLAVSMLDSTPPGGHLAHNAPCAKHPIETTSSSCTWARRSSVTGPPRS